MLLQHLIFFRREEEQEGEEEEEDKKEEWEKDEDEEEEEEEEAKHDKNKDQKMEERFLVFLWHLIPFHFRVIRARRGLINRDFPLQSRVLILFLPG